MFPHSSFSQAGNIYYVSMQKKETSQFFIKTADIFILGINEKILLKP